MDMKTTTVILCLGLCACADHSSDDPVAQSDNGGQAAEQGMGGMGGVKVDLAAGRGGTAADSAIKVDASAMLSNPDAAAAGVDGGAAGDSACPFLFCDDFEKGTLDPQWLKTTANGNKVEVEKVADAHGNFAVKFSVAPGTNWSFMRLKKNIPEIKTHLFGRAYIKLSPKSPGGHTAMFWAGNDGTGFPYFDNILSICPDGDDRWFIGWWNGGQETFHWGGKVPVARWACVEWEMQQFPEMITVWVDGKQDATYTDQKDHLKTGFSEFGFGYRSWHPPNIATTLYMDDLAIHNERIGCLPKP
jgi:hypothetical protein